MRQEQHRRLRATRDPAAPAAPPRTYDCPHEPAADEGLQEYLETKAVLGSQGVPA